MSMVSTSKSENLRKMEENDMKMTKEIAAKLVLRERRMLLPESEGTTGKRQLAAFAQLLDSCTDHTYVAGKELLEALAKVDVNDIKAYFKLFLDTLNESNSGGYDFKSRMEYSDYPETELTADDSELILRQFISYVTQYTDRFFDTRFHEEVFMSGEKVERGKNDKNEYATVKSTVVRPATMQDAYRILTAMIAAKTKLQPLDEDLLKEALNSLSNEEFLKVLPAKISQKTTLKMIASLMLSKDMPIDVLGIKNSVDALRLAHDLSGDFNKFHLGNKERKAILSIIDKDKYATALMFAKREEFLRLGETIHPGSFKNKYPNAFKAFSDLRSNNRTMKTFMSQYEIALDNGNILEAAKVLSYIPGKFAQALNQLLELAMVEDVQNEVLDIFEGVAPAAPRKLLYQTYYYFSNREALNDVAQDKYKLDRYTRPLVYSKYNAPISKEIIDRAAKIAYNAFAATLEDIQPAKYYIDKERFSKAKVDKIASRIEMRDTNWLRLFVYWVGMDVDLTACFLDDEFNYKGQVSWQHLRAKDDDDILAVHSEDIVYAPYGGNEYIDINRKVAKKRYEEDGYRYITIINFVYSGVSFNNMDDAFTGAMCIENPTMGDVFKPNSVAIKTSIKSGSANLAFLYDIVEDEIIPVNADISPNGNLSARGNTVSSCINEIKNACAAIVTNEKFNLYDYLVDVIKLTDGIMVESPEDADVNFSSNGIDIFDDVLYSEYI